MERHTSEAGQGSGANRWFEKRVNRFENKLLL
jgi:hypothetical protein